MYGNTSRSRGRSASQDRMGGPSRGGGAFQSVDRGGGGGWRGGRGRRDGGARGGRGGQGGRGGRGGHERSNRKLEQFGFRNLQSMAEKDADELVLDMTSERCILATENLVSEMDMDDGKVIVVLKVFAKACGCLTTLSGLNILLSKLPKSIYMSFHLSSYINRLANAGKDVDEREDELRLMIDLFTAMLRKLPNSFADLPIPQLYLAVLTLNNKGELFDQKIQPAVEALGELKNEMADKVKHEEEQTSRRPKRYNRRDEAALLDEEAPPDDFRDMSVVPTQDDVHATGVPFLRRNKVDGSYNSPEHYLDVQFRLLREDFVRPLRDGINDMLVRMGSGKMRPLQDIRVYHDVHILFPVFTSKGLTYKIGFDVNRLRSVRWENSKRLIYGSLLCLSKDKFETIILATVENRDVKELKEGRVEIRFTNTFERINQDKCSYQMVETTAYFEAYRHVLEGLKVIEPDRIPFKRYIVDCKCDTKPPAYLRNRLREGITYDLSPIMNKNTRDPLASLRRLRLSDRIKGEAVRILDDSSWPSAEDLELDESQFKAVKLALTSEFSLIQGPPGTGKTYIGLKVVKVLLHNKDKWMRGTEDDEYDDEDDDERLLRHRRPIRTSAASHPILVVCYTNHALDQFLEGIHEFHSEGIVRIGGRSQSEIMDKCSLRELKHQMQKNKETPREIRRAFYDIHCDLDKITNQMKSATDNLQKCMENLVAEKELYDGNFMTQEHYKQMTIDPATGVPTKQTMMCYWLGLMADGPFESSKAVTPIAIFPFTKSAKRNNLCNQHHVAFINKAKLAPGIDGSNGGSYELQGARDSFIYIPNMPDGFLDTWQSMTILLYVYPMSPNGGPIVCFQDQGIIGIEVSQDGVENGKGILKAVFNRRDGALLKPLRKAVLNMNQWNYIAASHDYESGFYRLWHDGKLVQELQNMNEQIVIGSQFPVFLGSFNLNWHTSYFEGRVCGLNIFPAAIGKQQICRIAGIREEDLVQQNDDDEEEEANGGQEEDEEEDEKEEKDNDILYEAEAEQDLRVLDVDEVTRFGEKRGRQVTKTLMTADPFLNDANSIPDTFQYQFHQKKSRKKKINDMIKRELSHGDMMSQQQASRVVDIWALSVKDKWRLYRYWIDQLCTNYRQIVERYQGEFENGAERLREVKSLEDQSILKNATVIGMTTTGAAKFRHLIQIIKPRITIVEEAAEVLESHIVTSLSPGCQHLILIGDHQQLRPNPTVFDLARNYQLDMSLFERMVTIGMRHERLNSQHRMRPEIASMMEHIYEDLQNHESVKNFESIKGVDSNIFFIEHNEFEDFVQEGRSRYNMHEAKYLAALCRYFILQGYKRTQITILTMYTGQLLQLKKEMPREFFRGVRVCAVDNFQGEENDIILLSLVRSNDEGQIGFLRTSNRVCVALSRAKKGFYCIGNIDIMCEKENLWKKIIGDMRNKGKVGPHLTLTCQKHPKNVIKASVADDFRKAPEGGCMEPCDTRLDCGHVCESVCHPGDPDHKDYKCRQKCTKMLCKDHRCRKVCWQECGECNVLVSKEIPRCLHQQQVPCYKNPATFPCQAPCLKKQGCGLHNCPKRCSEKCDPNCTVMVDKTLKCGHVNKVKCRVDLDQVTCKAPCGELLSCEHLCKGTCGDCFKGRVHCPCKAKCDRRLFCGHLCKESCTKNCPPCMQNCTNRCVHSECKKKCGEPCTPCTMQCAWKCTHHKCTMLCGEPCDRPRCNKPCMKILRCKHPCIGMCGEPCPKKCRVCHKDEVTEILFGDEDEPDARFVELEACGHVIEVNAMDQYMDDVAEDDSSIQLKGCPRCKTPIRTTLRYGNAIKTVLADFEKVKAKLIIPKYKLLLETERLKTKLFSNDLHPKLLDDKEKIEKALAMTVLTTEQLNMYENQINFLCFLSKTMNSVNMHVVRILTQQKMEFSRRIELKILDQTLQVQALVLRDGIMKLRGRYSDQEKEEINDELLRFSLVTAYSLLLNELKHHDADVDPRLSIIADVIESGRRIGKGNLDRYMDIIKNISVRRGLDIHYQQVTEQEKQLIVQAMGMAQGHWFKCPNGHIYCIGDCGGATVESRCPECKAVIGGTGHALRSDNTLAGEMDGARHSAWSDYTNNMGNFDLNNF